MSDSAESTQTMPSELAGDDGQRQTELAEIIRAYNEVTERLQQSHETLQAEVVRLREELASTNAQLQRSKRLSALGEMAAGIAHEIRNPLGAIQLYTNMVLEDVEAAQPGLETASDHLHRIASAVRGLNGIVNDVLSFARELEPSPQPVELAEQFDKALQTHRPALDEAGISVARPDRQQAPVTIEADPQLLQQALVNLVRNAVDAMSPDDATASETEEPAPATAPQAAGGGAVNPRRLTVDVEPDASGAVLTVRDSGPGIADTDVDRIFNPFFTTRNTGTGLGLAIVHRIVDAHGGTVSVHNDGGAVFQLALPSRPPETSQAETTTDHAEASA